MNKTDIQTLFKSIDEFDSDTFVSFLTDDASFRFANIPEVRGKDNIFEFVGNFFKSIKAIGHENLEMWEVPGTFFVNGVVTYTRHDGTSLKVPFSNTFKLQGNKIRDYLIFVDNSELYK